MNPVLTGFIIAIPIYFLFLLIYNQIKKNKELKKENTKLSKEKIFELLKSPQFKELVCWIRVEKEKKTSDRMIKKALKKNKWDDLTISQALKQVKESEKYAKAKTKPTLPSELNTKQRKGYEFGFKKQDGETPTSTTKRDHEDLAESQRATSTRTTAGITTGDSRGFERSDNGDEGAEQSRILQLPSVGSSKPDKRKSKWDWRSIKQDR